MKNIFSKTAILLLFLLGIASVAQAGRTGGVVYSGYFTNVGDSLSSIYYSSGPVGVGTNGPTAWLDVYNASTTTSLLHFQVRTATTTLFSITKNGLVINGGAGAASTTIATSTGAGSAAGTSTVAGGPNFMEITVVTGQGSAANKVIATTTLASACPNQIIPHFSAGNANAAALATTTSIFMVGASTTAFTLNTGSVGLAATTTYIWEVAVGCR